MNLLSSLLAFTARQIGALQTQADSNTSRIETSESDISDLTTTVNNTIVSNSNSREVLWSATGGVELYDGSITLSKDISNFDFIDIEYQQAVPSSTTRKTITKRIPAVAGSYEINDFAITYDNPSIDFYKQTLTLSATSLVAAQNYNVETASGSDTWIKQRGTYQFSIVRVLGVKLGSASPSELTDIRVGADGVTYNSAGAAVRGQLTDLKSDLTDSENGITHIASSKFSRGAIQNDGTINSQTYYASNNVDIQFDYPTKISVKDGYKYAIANKLSESSYSVGSFITYDTFIEPNVPFRLKIGRVTETWGAADLEVFSRQIDILSRSMADDLYNSAQIDQLKRGNEFLNAVFTRGSLTNGVIAAYVLYRIATPNIVRYSRKITITAETGFRFAIHTFNSSDVFVADLGWFTSKTIEANQGFKMIIARTTDNTSESANVFDFYSQVSVQTELTDYIDAKASNPEMPLLSSPIFSNGRAKLVAHTGYTANAPENTIPAFEAAGKRGFWGIESDLQQTSDGYYVMCHDATVDRTTDGSGTISSMTLAQIRALHITADTSLQIPTFEEYLAICKHYGCVPVVEIKSTITNTKASFETITAIVKKYGFSDKSIIFLGSKWNISAFKQAAEAIPFMPVYQYEFSYDWDAEFANTSAYKNVGMDWDVLDTITLARAIQCHNNDMLYGAFTVDSAQTVKELFEKGVDFVTTNTVLPTD